MPGANQEPCTELEFRVMLKNLVTLYMFQVTSSAHVTDSSEDLHEEILEATEGFIENFNILKNRVSK